MFDPQWIEETTVDVCWGVVLAVVVALVLVGIGVGIGWLIWA